MRAAADISYHFHNYKTTCRHLSKDSRTTAKSLLLWLQPSLWHWAHGSPAACRQLRAQDTENSLIWRMGIWALSSKDTRVRFNIERNKLRVDQLPKETHPWTWYRPTGKCSLCRFEAASPPVYPTGGSNQAKCGLIRPFVIILKKCMIKKMYGTPSCLCEY